MKSRPKSLSACCEALAKVNMVAKEDSTRFLFCTSCGNPCDLSQRKTPFKGYSTLGKPSKRKLRKGSVFKMTPQEYKDHLAKPKKSSKDDKKYWKRQADKWYSEFIRLRDADEFGFVTCITSGRRLHWRQVDCGHWISRAKESVRYDERNTNAQSKGSNRFQGGHFLEHGLAIEKKFGAGTRGVLEKKAGQKCKRTMSDYRFLAEEYKARVENIRQQEPQKYGA